MSILNFLHLNKKNSEYRFFSISLPLDVTSKYHMYYNHYGDLRTLIPDVACFSLLKVSLDTASKGGSGRVMSAIEVCECPAGYTGTSCEVGIIMA